MAEHSFDYSSSTVHKFNRNRHIDTDSKKSPSTVQKKSQDKSSSFSIDSILNSKISKNSSKESPEINLSVVREDISCASDSDSDSVIEEEQVDVVENNKEIDPENQTDDSQDDSTADEDGLIEVDCSKVEHENEEISPNPKWITPLIKPFPVYSNNSSNQTPSGSHFFPSHSGKWSYLFISCSLFLVSLTQSTFCL